MSSSSSSSASSGTCTYTWDGSNWVEETNTCKSPLTAHPPDMPSSGSSIPVGTTRDGTCS